MEVFTSAIALTASTSSESHKAPGMGRAQTPKDAAHRSRSTGSAQTSALLFKD
jgi:hypothetical protein